jgi:hypothetical protein
MSPIPDDFEQLRRLLALKRHEQPPPGYFYGFSRQVIVRIKAGELGDAEETSIWSFGGGSLLQRIWATFDARPVLAGAFGAAVCGFFVVGALLSDNTTVTAKPVPSPPPVVQLGMGQPPVWVRSTDDAEVPSTYGDSAHYQPPANSLFDQIRKKQESPQSYPESRLATPAMPVQVSYPLNH